jgi:hypothetical protein
VLDLPIIRVPADIPPGPYPWEGTDWTVPAVAVFLFLAAAVVVIAVLLIRRGRR